MEFSILTTHVLYLSIMIGTMFFVYLHKYFPAATITVVRARRTAIRFNLSGMLWMMISFAVLLVPLVIRTCGADTDEYYKIYAGDYILATDSTFSYLCAVLRHITTDPKTGLGIISALSLILIFRAILNVKDDIDIPGAFLAFVTALYFYLYNYMRIMLAVGIVLVGYSYIVKGNKKKTAICFCIAPFFHRSAVVVFLVYLVILFFAKYKKIVLLGGLAGVAAFLARPSLFFGIISEGSYNSYIDSSIYKGAHVSIGTTLQIVPFFAILYLYKKYRREAVYSAALYFCIANLAFSLLGYFVAPASRISNMYFVFHFMFFLPWLIKKEPLAWKRVCIRLFAFAFCAAKYYLLSQNFRAMVILPYS